MNTTWGGLSCLQSSEQKSTMGKERLLDGMLLLLLLDFLLRWLVIVVDLLRRMLERILNSCLISPSESWGSCSFCL